MNFIKKIALSSVITLCPAVAQTAAEQLQKGIFDQETQGKVDDAINIYRQLANSTLTPREIAAQAQYRLSQSLLQKGDIANATREMERLERDFSEYKNLIASLASQKGLQAMSTGDIPPPSPLVQYNMNSRATFQGKVKHLIWIDPMSWLTIDSNGQDYRIQLASPNMMLKGGATKNSIKLGDDVVILGAEALDGTPTLLAITVTSADGQTLFDRAKAEDQAKAEKLAARQANGK
jgi:hypothetical protein